MNRNITFLLGNAAFAGALAGWAYVQFDWLGAAAAIAASFLVGKMLRDKGRN